MKKECAIFLTARTEFLPSLLKQILTWDQNADLWILRQEAAKILGVDSSCVSPYVIDRNTLVIVGESEESQSCDVDAITKSYDLISVSVKERKIS